MANAASGCYHTSYDLSAHYRLQFLCRLLEWQDGAGGFPPRAEGPTANKTPPAAPARGRERSRASIRLVQVFGSRDELDLDLPPVLDEVWPSGRRPRVAASVAPGGRLRGPERIGRWGPGGHPCTLCSARFPSRAGQPHRPFETRIPCRRLGRRGSIAPRQVSGRGARGCFPVVPWGTVCAAAAGEDEGTSRDFSGTVA
jgi:hypothetical protein